MCKNGEYICGNKNFFMTHWVKCSLEINFILEIFIYQPKKLLKSL